MNKSTRLAYLLQICLFSSLQSEWCVLKNYSLPKLLIFCIHDTFTNTKVQCEVKNFCCFLQYQIDHCITKHLQPLNFSLKVLYWINLNSIVLKRYPKNFWKWMLGKSYRLNKNKELANRKITKFRKNTRRSTFYYLYG